MNQKNFIEIVKRKRESIMMSQKELARKIPISKTAYSKIENHLQNPDFFVIRRLAEIFNIDLNILKENDPMPLNYD